MRITDGPADQTGPAQVPVCWFAELDRRGALAVVELRWVMDEREPREESTMLIGTVFTDGHRPLQVMKVRATAMLTAAGFVPAEQWRPDVDRGLTVRPVCPREEPYVSYAKIMRSR